MRDLLQVDLIGNDLAADLCRSQVRVALLLSQEPELSLLQLAGRPDKAESIRGSRLSRWLLLALINISLVIKITVEVVSAVSERSLSAASATRSGLE